MQLNHVQHLKEGCQIIFIKLFAGNSSFWLTYYITDALQRKGLFFQETYHVLGFFGPFSAVLIFVSVVFLVCLSF